MDNIRTRLCEQPCFYAAQMFRVIYRVYARSYGQTHRKIGSHDYLLVDQAQYLEAMMHNTNLSLFATVEQSRDRVSLPSHSRQYCDTFTNNVLNGLQFTTD